MLKNDCENDCEKRTTRVVMATAGIGTSIRACARARADYAQQRAARRAGGVRSTGTYTGTFLGGVVWADGAPSMPSAEEEAVPPPSAAGTRSKAEEAGRRMKDGQEYEVEAELEQSRLTDEKCTTRGGRAICFLATAIVSIRP